jgi:hypothetical protein
VLSEVVAEPLPAGGGLAHPSHKIIYLIRMYAPNRAYSSLLYSAMNILR